MLRAAGGLAQSGLENVPFDDIGFAGLLAVVVWWLVRRVDRDDNATQTEIARLRELLETERTAHRQQVDALRDEHKQMVAAEQESWRAEYERLRDWTAAQVEREREITQRKSEEKHAVIQRLSAAEGALHSIAMLAPSCTCGTLNPVEPILARWRNETG